MAQRSSGITLERAAGQLRCALDSPAAVYLLSLAANSRGTQVSALRAAAAAFGRSVREVAWESIDNDQMAVLRAALVSKGFAPATGNRILAAVRATMMVCVRRGTMTRDAYDRATSQRPIKGVRVPKGRALDNDEIRRLFESLTTGRLADRRNAALLALTYGGGFRRAEVVSLTLADLDIPGATVRVIGKGNSERIVPLPAGTMAALRAWLAVRGPAPGALLCTVRDGVDVGRHLHPTYVYTVLREIGCRAGVARFSPHDLRRSYVGDLLDAGADLRTVQGLVGHASPNTTARYDRRGLRAAVAAASLIRVPF